MAQRKLIIEKVLTKEVLSMLEEIDGSELIPEITSRIGSVTLDDGRVGQVHVIVTTDKNDFLELE